MTHLIDKDALVTEIDRRIKVLQKNPYENHKTICHLDSLKRSIDTLEVKEVDLEKEIEFEYNPIDGLSFEDFAKIAKHFFELGLSVNNPITASDRGTAEEIIINLKRVEQDYRINLTKEIEWVRNQAQKGEEV